MITSLIALLACHGMPGQQEPPKWKATDLPTTTRPFVEIDRFKKVKFMRVQEIETWTPGQKASNLMRYYYFTYKAEYDEEAKLWESLFPKSKGWIYPDSPAGSLMLNQSVDHPKISFHGMILGSGTMVLSTKDPKLPFHRSDPEWVTVSLFEVIKRS